MYNDDEPNVFHLLFPKYEMVLESETEQDAKEWVEKIKDGESCSHCQYIWLPVCYSIKAFLAGASDSKTPNYRSHIS